MKKNFLSIIALCCATAFPLHAEPTDEPIALSETAAEALQPEETTEAPATDLSAALPAGISSDQLLTQANADYDAGRYSAAAQAYETVLAQSGSSAALYYNLGNAYFKDHQYARAILNYERSLLLDPTDEDASANLDMARANTVDKLDSIEPVIFVQWSRALRDLLSCDAWAWCSIVFFLLFIVGLFLYFFTHASQLRRLGFYGGLLGLIFSVVSIAYAHEQYQIITVRDHAIVLAPTVTVRSSPAESGTQLFTLHEGTKVQIRSSLGGWIEIQLSDGNVGWMPKQDAEVI
jgi:tetratricopeptide (TPR) repeat protein